MDHLRVGDWSFNPSDGTLRAGERVVRLEPRVHAVFQLLIDNRGSVVTHDRLWRQVWQETHVAPGALARTISVLRDALEDDARQPRYIETVPKRGYRLIAAVEVMPAVEDVAPIVADTDRRAARAWRTRLALIAATLVFGLWPHHDIRPMKRPVGGFEFPHHTRVGNERAYEHYARAAARNPNSAHAHAGLATVYVFRAGYLPDRERWVSAAMESAERALNLDPASPRVMRALGMAHALKGQWRDAARFYQRALAIEPSDGTTSTNLGIILMEYGQVADALVQYERHAALSPDSPYPYAYLAGGLAVAGYPSESVAAAEAALALEPYDLIAQLVLVRNDLMSGAYDAARGRLTRLLEGHTDCVECVTQLGLIDQLQGRLASAAERYRAAQAMMPRSGAVLRLAQVLRLIGETTEAERLLRAVERAALDALAGGTESSSPAWQLAVVAAIRDDRAAALDRYRQAVEAGRRDAPWDRWDPLFSALRAEPSFREAQLPADREHQTARAVARRLSTTLRRVKHLDMM